MGKKSSILSSIRFWVVSDTGTLTKRKLTYSWVVTNLFSGHVIKKTSVNYIWLFFRKNREDNLSVVCSLESMELHVRTVYSADRILCSDVDYTHFVTATLARGVVGAPFLKWKTNNAFIRIYLKTYKIIK